MYKENWITFIQMKGYNWFTLFFVTIQYLSLFTCMPRSPTQIGPFTHHLWFNVKVNKLLNKANESEKHYIFPETSKEKSTSMDGFEFMNSAMTA